MSNKKDPNIPRATKYGPLEGKEKEEFTNLAIAAGGYYDYDGVFNSITTYPGDKRLYRERVEVFIFKGDDVCINLKPSDYSDRVYNLPGGSCNAGVSRMDQAIAECREEVRMEIKNIRSTGVIYKEYTAYPKWAEEKEPIRWDGRCCEVFVADYAGKYTGYIAKHDKDPGMLKNSKWHNIHEVFDILKKEHKEALCAAFPGRFEKYSRSIPNEIVKFNDDLNSHWQYGVVHNGRIITGNELEYDFDFYKDYKSLSLHEFDKYKTGVCWDYVHYEADWFKHRGYKYDAYYLEATDKGGYNRSHAFLVFYLPSSSKAYYFESAWHQYQGIEEFDSTQKLLDTIVERHLELFDDPKHAKKTVLYTKYDAMSKAFEHIGCMDYMVKATDGKTYALKEDAMIHEGIIRPVNDIYYNKDKFDSGETNLCFIVGHSGSGKSTMGREMQGGNIEHYEVDDVSRSYNFSDDNLDEYGDLISSFFKGPGKKYRLPYGPREEAEKKKKTFREYPKEVRMAFIDYAMKYSKSHPDTKFVLDGVWAVSYFEPDTFDDYAVYIKGTPALQSSVRALKRDMADPNSQMGPLSKEIPGKIRMVKDLEPKLKKYRSHFSDKATDESAAIVEGFMRSEEDIYHNMDLFESGKQNVVFVIGFSGSGKSTVAEELASLYNAEHVNLDTFSMLNLKDSDRSPLCKKWCETRLAKEYFRMKREKHKFTQEYMEVYWSKVIEFVMKNASRKNRYIVEGIQLFTVMDPKQLVQYPLVIKGTAAVISILRRYQRDGKIGRAGKISVIGVLRYYIKNHRTLENIRKEVDRFNYEGDAVHVKVNTPIIGVNINVKTEAAVSEFGTTAGTVVGAGGADSVYIVNYLQNNVFSGTTEPRTAICKTGMHDIHAKKDSGRIGKVDEDEFFKTASDIKVYKYKGKSKKSFNEIVEAATDDLDLYKQLTGRDLPDRDFIEYDSEFVRETCFIDTLNALRECTEACLESIRHDLKEIPILTETVQGRPYNYKRDLNGVFIQHEITGIRSKSYDDKESIPEAVVEIVKRGYMI